jgi:uncharacterized protein (TIGR02271 family)
MNDRIREGMAVYSSDGEKLGKVLTCDNSTFIIEKGFFFPKDYVARYGDIARVDGEDVHLSLTKSAFSSDGHMEDVTEHREGWTGAGGFQGARTDARATERRDVGVQASSREDVRVPVVEEELDVVKRQKSAGEVRLRKETITETKHIEVPVMREEVRVERVPVSDGRAATDAAFDGKTVSMPVTEEEIEIRKRPVVKEEVRLRKERHVEQRAASADVRKEQVHVDGASASGEDIRKHTNLGKEPGTGGILDSLRRDDPDFDKR